jgi:hypothetical protein
MPVGVECGGWCGEYESRWHLMDTGWCRAGWWHRYVDKVNCVDVMYQTVSGSLTKGGFEEWKR